MRKKFGIWEFRKTNGGSGEGFRYLMFSVYKDTLKYVQIHIHSKIHQAYLKGKVSGYVNFKLK